MKLSEVIKRLKKGSLPQDLAGMARFGITPDKAFGTKIPVIRKLAKEIGKDHALATALWKAGYRETQILAAMVEEPEKVTGAQMDKWSLDFSYWEICDQCCMNLFYFLPDAKKKAISWTRQEGTQQKRAGFALMAVMAWKDKESDDKLFKSFFPHIKKGATDPRGPVKKAVSWAIRNIGKRNLALNKEAVKLAREIDTMDHKSAKWVAKDALRELQDKKQLDRLKKKT